MLFIGEGDPSHEAASAVGVGPGRRFSVLTFPHATGEDGRTEPDSSKQRNLLIAGVVLVAIAVALGLGAGLAPQNGSSGDNPEEESTASFSCTVGAAGVGLIAQGLSRGHSAPSIIATVGGPLAANQACRQAITALTRNPSEPVELNLRTQEGTVPETVTGNGLASSTPPPPTDASGARLQRIIDCIGWEAGVLYDACVEGQLPPPAR